MASNCPSPAKERTQVELLMLMSSWKLMDVSELEGGNGRRERGGEKKKEREGSCGERGAVWVKLEWIG